MVVLQNGDQLNSAVVLKRRSFPKAEAPLKVAELTPMVMVLPTLPIPARTKLA
jgi:hypothetical protein